MAADILQELEANHFRVVIFGSARIKPGMREYNRIFELAKMIGAEGIDMVTGGGPGLMDAAMSGHFAGRKSVDNHEIGLQIKLPMEQVDSKHYDIKQEFDRFSSRLDTFMSLANVIVVAPGGIGTLLELSYTWQLMQVKHTCKLPIILFGEEWFDFVEWVKRWPLQQGLLDPADVDLLYLTKEVGQAMSVIRQAHGDFLKDPDLACSNARRYEVR